MKGGGGYSKAHEDFETMPAFMLATPIHDQNCTF